MDERDESLHQEWIMDHPQYHEHESYYCCCCCYDYDYCHEADPYSKMMTDWEIWDLISWRGSRLQSGAATQPCCPRSRISQSRRRYRSAGRRASRTTDRWASKSARTSCARVAAACWDWHQASRLQAGCDAPEWLDKKQTMNLKKKQKMLLLLMMMMLLL